MDEVTISRYGDKWTDHRWTLQQSHQKDHIRELLCFTYQYILTNNPDVLEPEIVKFCT